MKKAYLMLITSIILFSLTNIGLAQAGCVTIKVQYNDNCPRSNSDVTYGPNGNDYYFDLTNESGIVTKCGVVAPGDWAFIAWYNSVEFEPGGSGVHVDGNGDGSGTITKWGYSYPNGTESCRDSECDGLKYCYSGNPPYVECRHSDQTPIWNYDCDTKKCCLCNGGTIANPTQNFAIQNGECLFCQKCTAIDTCSYQADGEDLKDQCSADNCKYGYCNGAGACKMKPNTTDCGTCALCNGLGDCNVYNPTQNSDCPATSCPDSCNIDSNPFTFDYANDETNYCSGLFNCTNNPCIYNHACADPFDGKA
jgi:hypothetical protein